MAKGLLEENLWEIIEPLLPSPKQRRYRYPGRKPVEHRVALTGILFVLRTGIPWEYFPKEMGCSGMTCLRRLKAWQRRGVWKQLHEVLLAKLQGANKINWERAVADSSSVRAVGGGKKRARILRIDGSWGANTTCSPMGEESPLSSALPKPTATTLLN